MVLIETALFILGLTLLLKGSEFFVRSAASIAEKMGVSEFVIGLTLVAIGTSMPEIASAITASREHESAIIIGNVVGANAVNIGLIVGIASILAVIKTNEEMVKRDGYIMLFAALLFYVFIYNRQIEWIEGAFFLLLYIVYTIYLFETKPEIRGRYHFKEFIRYFFGFRYMATVKNGIKSGIRKGMTKDKGKTKEQFKKGLVKDGVIMVLGIIGIGIGANYFIDGAVFLANFFGIPKMLIGLTIVSLGTTLPELSVTIASARKGYGNIAIGNIIGSNIANIFLILGIASLINPLSVTELTLMYTAPFMILMCILLLVFISSDWEVRRKEGIIFLFLYILFITFMFWSAG